MLCLHAGVSESDEQGNTRHDTIDCAMAGDSNELLLETQPRSSYSCSQRSYGSCSDGCRSFDQLGTVINMADMADGMKDGLGAVSA